MGECGGPAAVTQGMHLHPDSILPFAQLQRARTAWHPKVPMVAAAAPGQFTFASNDQSAPSAIVENLPGGEPEIDLEHVALIVDPRPHRNPSTRKRRLPGEAELPAPGHRLAPS